MFPYSYPSPVVQRREQREPFCPIVGISSWDGQSRSAWTKAVPGIHTTFWFKLIVLEKARRVVYPKPCQIVGVNATSNHVSFILAPFILSTLSHNNVTAFPFEPSIRLRSFITYPGNTRQAWELMLRTPTVESAVMQRPTWATEGYWARLS